MKAAACALAICCAAPAASMRCPAAEAEPWLRTELYFGLSRDAESVLKTDSPACVAF